MISNSIKYIELVGVAGCGKTTISKLLLKEFQKKEMMIKSRDVVGKNLWFRIQIICNIISVLISFPNILSFYLLSTKKAYKSTPHIRPTISNLITRMIIDTAVVRCMLKNSSKHIMNDEGIIGKLVSLSVLTEITENQINTSLERLLPKPTILVYVISAPIIALKREHSRKIKLPFFHHMAYKLKEKFFHEAVNLYKKQFLKDVAIANVRELSINNTGNFNSLTKEIVTLSNKIYTMIL